MVLGARRALLQGCCGCGCSWIATHWCVPLKRWAAMTCAIARVASLQLPRGLSQMMRCCRQVCVCAHPAPAAQAQTDNAPPHSLVSDIRKVHMLQSASMPARLSPSRIRLLTRQPRTSYASISSCCRDSSALTAATRWSCSARILLVSASFAEVGGGFAGSCLTPGEIGYPLVY